tara:strand:+ start:5997 stop:6497 length:501 start_codon:yes stop_codon:yes gene_type:complete
MDYYTATNTSTTMSLWDTLPIDIADIIMHKAMEIHFKPLCDELKTFHKQRLRTYAYKHRRGIELECVKSTVSVWGHTLDVPRKGGMLNGAMYNNELVFLKRDENGHIRYYAGGTEGAVWTRDARKGLVAHVKQFIPDHEKLRKANKFPKIEKCTNKQLMHLLITSD